MDLLTNIKTLKLKYKYTNEELSAKTEIPVGTLNKILCGSSPDPKISTLLALANTFGCTVDYLINGENSSNNEISDDDRKLIDSFNSLDDIGKETVGYIMKKELKRVQRSKASFELEDDDVREILLYDMPVSAGVGSFIDSGTSSHICIKDNYRTKNADFAVRVSGNSMEPEYFDGDILLVSSDKNISTGGIGIFMLNGDAYVKQFQKGKLVSLNNSYSDIIIKDTDNFECNGIVLGKVKKR